MKKVVVFIIVTILILLTPIPYYLRSGECRECLPYDTCQCGPRLYFDIPVWAWIIQQYYEFTRTSTFFPIYNFFHSVPKDIWCKKDGDCAVNICVCKAVRKETLQSKDAICARYCPGNPVCDRGHCMLDTTK